jgi:hypothetical protein
MNNDSNLDNPIVLMLAWINYMISYIFADVTLSKLALVLSIIGSIVYIYTTILKHFNKKDDEKINK